MGIPSQAPAAFSMELCQSSYLIYGRTELAGSRIYLENTFQRVYFSFPFSHAVSGFVGASLVTSLESDCEVEICMQVTDEGTFPRGVWEGRWGQDKEGQEAKVQLQAMSSKGGCDLVCRRTLQVRSCISLAPDQGRELPAWLGLGCRGRIGGGNSQEVLAVCACRQKVEGHNNGIKGWEGMGRALSLSAL